MSNHPEGDARGRIGGTPTPSLGTAAEPLLEELVLAPLDFAAAAELFPRKSSTNTKLIGFMRFAHAADAIQYAIEAVPAGMLPGTSLVIGEQRFSGKEIRRLYDGADYPLMRTL